MLSCYLILFWFLWVGSLRIAFTVLPCLSWSNPWYLMLSESDWLVIWEPVIGRSAGSLLTCSDYLKIHLILLVDILLIGRFSLFGSSFRSLNFAILFEWFTWRFIGKILCRTVYGYNSIDYISLCCLQWEENFIERKFLFNSYMRVIQWSSLKFFCWTNCGCNYF